MEHAEKRTWDVAIEPESGVSFALPAGFFYALGLPRLYTKDLHN